MAQSEQSMFTIKEAAEASGYSELRVAQLQREGKIRRVKDKETGRILIPLEEVLMLANKIKDKDARKQDQKDAGRKFPYKKPSRVAYDMVIAFIKRTKMDSRVRRRLLVVMEQFRKEYDC